MPRPLRRLIPGYPVHVVHRGNNRQPIFTCDGDFLFYHARLGEAARRFGVEIHGYVYMTNHVHLLLSCPDAGGISGMIHLVAQRYAVYFNDRYARTGTLWEGRFRSAIIGSDVYLFACHRYIDCNPVRAGLVADPANYPWSSHRHYASGRPDPLITRHSMFRRMSGEAYRSMFSLPLPDDELQRMRSAFSQSRPVGLPEPERRKPGRPRKNPCLAPVFKPPGK
jgi:putative transposase